MGKALGIGGVFFRSKDREALGAWYQKTLGFDIDESYGGSSFIHDKAPKGACTVWGPFKEDTDYFKPSDKGFMFNLIVDDLDECLKQVKEHGGELVGEPCEESYGKFAWFMDPEGNKVELWQILNDGSFDS